MSRPSDEQVAAWCRSPDMDWSELQAELRRARAAEEALEAKLREAEGRVLRLLSRIEEDERQIREWRETAVGVEERAEKAERERDEARGRLEMASCALHDAAVWRNSPAHASDWRKCTDGGCVQDRTALGEKL